MRLEQVNVHYMPAALEPGLLYVSREFNVAIHLCACGCGSKVVTPLRETEWTLEESAVGATLTPSIGNWQKPCQSHYWIRNGEVIWSGKWTPEQILEGREAEAAKRDAYYRNVGRKRISAWERVWKWLIRVLRRRQ